MGSCCSSKGQVLSALDTDARINRDKRFEHIDTKGSQHISLLKDEKSLGMMMSEAITTATFLTGIVHIDGIKEKVGEMLRSNPWLACRLVSKGREKELVFPAEFEGDIDTYFEVITDMEVDATMSYPKICNILRTLPQMTMIGKDVVDQDLPLFKVCIIKKEENESCHHFI